ncbi:hypothetical protein BN7_5135 [Wickerhamomyces ciferrii]|uniref:Luciferase-like domain-containing protein n=1 Tax=Wickerhamomyces ciferrii (strain ATCC 14091 / BCRC 22168 / CBS 111 / JCM 3599 / NBRC 0793 / NRRL Y-1031 F-60-10) TaxID=1206466 RepID=K0KWR3_WICCF|nr:uncharacterized protein BN7_5135 [Wickerhamomyces ciferrii]CCH45553.1 hypothetical protein BN7_5135 [Wickerhamomyces ciferrii]
MSQPTKKQKTRKPLIINAFLMGSSGHQSAGIWSHPRDKSPELYTSIEYWQNLAKLLEKGKFHSCFIADVLGPYDVYNGPRNYDAVALTGAQWPISDPSYFIPLMASVTENLNFGMTFSTISEEPYHLARRLGTLDLITNGRIGWNIVTSYLESGARNLLGGKALPSHEERYERCDEYTKVIYKLLLSSWRDDAVKLDKLNRIFTDPKALREINHKGKYFDVTGPSITQPSKQRLPIIIQAGTSSKGMEFAAENAEVVFLSGFSPELLAPRIAKIRQLSIEKFNRPSDSIKFLSLITLVVGETEEEAAAKFEEYKSYTNPEGSQALFSGWSGFDIGTIDPNDELHDVKSNAISSFIENWTKAVPGINKWTREVIADQLRIGGSGPKFIGTPEQIADELERWVDIAKVDGFNFAYTVLPESYEDIVELVIPELQKRGLAQTEYQVPGGSFREQLYGDGVLYPREDHPGFKYQWRQDFTKEEFEKHLNNNGI